MTSEWMKVMLEEIERKKTEAEQARAEEHRRIEEHRRAEEQARAEEHGRLQGRTAGGATRAP